MSRIGNSPIVVPKGVSVAVNDTEVIVKGRQGVLTVRLPTGVAIEQSPAGDVIFVRSQCDDRNAKALHGLARSLLANTVSGVHEPWEKRLEIVGVGFQATLASGKLTLNVGFANPIVILIPVGVQCELPDNTHVVLKSADRQLVGQVAANIRSVRPPEPYKGKGVRYAGERVKRKQGKAFGS